MDILIKNMEMPKDDALSVIIYPDGVVEVQIGWNGDIPVYSNAFKATAIPVPEHGRLVDLDAFLEARKNMATWEEYLIEDIDNYFENPSVVVLERTT